MSAGFRLNVLAGVGLLAVAFFGAFTYSSIILDTLTAQLASSGVTVLTISPMESLYTRFYISSVITAVISAPVLLYSLYRYLAPALYLQEKRLLKMLLFPISAAFLTGFSSGCLLLPGYLNYFISSQSILGENTTVSLLKYISFLGCTGAVCGALACYPIVLYALSAVHIVDSSCLVQYRRHTIVLAFIAGALLTPPDVVTQVCLALPFIALHEFGIFIIKLKEGVTWKKLTLIKETA